MVDVQVSLYKIKFTSNSNPQAQVRNPESREKIAEIDRWLRRAHDLG